MDRRNSRSRSGHCGFWILLVLVSWIVTLVMITIMQVTFHGKPPVWFKVFALAANPPVWMLLLMGAMILGELLHRAELQASRIGLAVWQFSTEKVMGFIPHWLFSRTLAVAAALATTLLGLFCWNAGGNRPLIDAMSVGTVAVATVAAMLALVVEVVLAAQLSPNPVRVEVERK